MATKVPVWSAAGALWQRIWDSVVMRARRFFWMPARNSLKRGPSELVSVAERPSSHVPWLVSVKDGDEGAGVERGGGLVAEDLGFGGDAGAAVFLDAGEEFAEEGTIRAGVGRGEAVVARPMACFSKGWRRRYRCGARRGPCGRGSGIRW